MFRPVDGWDAVPIKVSAETDHPIDSYFVRDCPLFEADRPKKPAREDIPRCLDADFDRAVLLYKRGKSYDEIARRLGRTKGAVKKMLYTWYDGREVV